MRHLSLAVSAIAGIAAAGIVIGCATAPSDAETSAQAAAMLKTSFKPRGQARARPARSGRDTETLQRIRGQSRAEGRCRAHREGESGADPLARRRQARRQLEGRREDRAGRPWDAIFRRSRNCRPARTATPATGCRRRSSPTGRSAPACTSSESRAATRKRCASMSTARSTTPMAYSACTNMPRFGAQRNPDRVADNGRRRSADGSRIAGQQVAAPSRLPTRGADARAGKCLTTT